LRTDPAIWVSRHRFQEYLVSANHDPDVARELYEWNVAVSGAFFELIAHVEVALRNAVDDIMGPLEVPASARIDVRRGWWFASPTFLEDSDLDFYTTARRHLGKKADTAPRDKLLASITFGFWTNLFNPGYEDLFRKHLVYAFPHRPRAFKRSAVQTNVIALRNLRNRIAHHQAIFDLPLQERYEQAMEILAWISPELRAWVDATCRVSSLLDHAPAAAPSTAVIVPARKAWPLYRSHGAYVCQPGRYFRQISHVGFYSDSAVQPEIAKVISRRDHVPWNPEEISRLMSTRIAEDARLAALIRDSREQGWTDDEYQVFFLTTPEPGNADRGHVTLAAPLPNHRKGRGSAWVRRQRYVPVSDLTSARSLGDLERE
jgi:hypothetical protein